MTNPNIFTQKQLTLMMQMQNEQNIALDGPDWYKKGRPYFMAVMAESVEAMEHIGWTWWKPSNTEMDEQACQRVGMEIVDILHFMLSHVVRYGLLEGDTIEERARYEYDGQFEGDDIVLSVDMTDINVRACSDAELYAYNNLLMLLNRHEFCLIIEMARRIGWTPSDIVRQYIGKNVLNLFRKANGYKTGEYQKHWHWVNYNGDDPVEMEGEDNDFLQELIGMIPDTGNNPGFIALLEKHLAKAYAAVRDPSEGGYVLDPATVCGGAV